MKDLDFKSLPKIIAVDFDGTIVANKFPNIGIFDWPLVSTLKTLREDFGVKLVLWTCRTDKMLVDAVDACTEAGLEFDAINTNIKEVRDLTGGDTRKVYADIYLDDKSVSAYQDKLYWLSHLSVDYTEFVEKEASKDYIPLGVGF